MAKSSYGEELIHLPHEIERKKCNYYDNRYIHKVMKRQHRDLEFGVIHKVRLKKNLQKSTLAFKGVEGGEI